jgi:hypothetical protein
VRGGGHLTMTFNELKKACDEAEAQRSATLGYVIVKVRPRRREGRTYRICKGLSGQVIGGSGGLRYVALECAKVREFLSRYPGNVGSF